MMADLPDDLEEFLDAGGDLATLSEPALYMLAEFVIYDRGRASQFSVLAERIRLGREYIARYFADEEARETAAGVEVEERLACPPSEHLPEEVRWRWEDQLAASEVLCDRVAAALPASAVEEHVENLQIDGGACYTLSVEDVGFYVCAASGEPSFGPTIVVRGRGSALRKALDEALDKAEIPVMAFSPASIEGALLEARARSEASDA